MVARAGIRSSEGGLSARLRPPGVRRVWIRVLERYGWISPFAWRYASASWAAGT